MTSLRVILGWFVLIDDVANKRVGCRVGQWFYPEPSGSGFRLFVFGVIVPIPPHTQNISCHAGKYVNRSVNMKT